ncbi:hypothetical protein H5410_031710 [Solanum commersonii]|uniref:Uncharacterized protein n=1 Tax=Solanum commersonii TaxID=4109 RepID=A0A9J5YMI7_SOLCO|nr:hypothetical protein H5410_031710 [Solanum commersonii]
MASTMFYAPTFQENVAKQVLSQNGIEAGDVRAKEYISLLKSNDPVGFHTVDLLAWGSIFIYYEKNDINSFLTIGVGLK